MREEWKINLLGCESSDNGVPGVKIDKYKIIGNYVKTIGCWDDRQS